MPYTMACKADPDDGLIHDKKTRETYDGKTVCGKKIKEYVRIGTGGIFPNRNQACKEC
jgi:hypothetical protein